MKNVRAREDSEDHLIQTLHSIGEGGRKDPGDGQASVQDLTTGQCRSDTRPQGYGPFVQGSFHENSGFPFLGHWDTYFFQKKK